MSAAYLAEVVVRGVVLFGVVALAVGLGVVWFAAAVGLCAGPDEITRRQRAVCAVAAIAPLVLLLGFLSRGTP